MTNNIKNFFISKKILAFIIALIGIFVIVRYTGPSAVLEEPYRPNNLFVDDELLTGEDQASAEYVDDSANEEIVGNSLPESVSKEEPEIKNETIETAKTVPSSDEIIILEVPFTSQAPFAGWDDSRQQDGCEEASVLMAMYWVEDKTLTKLEALDKIVAISEYELKEFGSYKDTSASDTFTRIVKGYFNYDNGEVANGIVKQDLIDALYEGDVVIVPAKGRLLANPNYKAPGPEHHMLVVRGYDPVAKEFITNDPGTRLGEGYRYDEDVFFEAIHNYATSNSPVDNLEDKVMIVVRK